jgi:hypothetical protein
MGERNVVALLMRSCCSREACCRQTSFTVEVGQHEEVGGVPFTALVHALGGPSIKQIKKNSLLELGSNYQVSKAKTNQFLAGCLNFHRRTRDTKDTSSAGYSSAFLAKLGQTRKA